MSGCILNREINCIQRFGKVLALFPYTSSFKFNKFLFLASICIVIFQNAWIWDSLKTDYFVKNSDRLHYLTFQAAIWTSFVLSRLGFGLACIALRKLLTRSKEYIHTYLKPNPDKKRDSFLKNKFKLTTLGLLNLIFLGQIVEFAYRRYAPLSKGELDFHNYCNRKFFPCPTDPKFGFITIGLEVLMKFMEISTVYYATYIIIIVGDLLYEVLEQFKIKVLKEIGKARGEGKNVDIEMVTPIFILKQNGHSKKGKDEVLEINADVTDDIHEQFTKIKELATSINCAMGPILIVSCFDCILVFICIVYSMVPKLKSYNNYGSGAGMGTSFSDFNFTNNYGMDSNYTTDETFGFSFIPKNDPDRRMPMFSFVFAILYECKAVIIAFIGTFLKIKVMKMKEAFDDKFYHRSATSTYQEDPQKMWLSPENEQDEEEIQDLINRVTKWNWQLRPMDMMSLDLSFLPMMIGTVMTYVVVLLQIQISEGP